MKNLLCSAAIMSLSYVGGITIVQAETLQDVLAVAYANNPTLEAGRASLRATDEGVNQANAGWRPTISVNGDISYSNLSTNQLLASQGTAYPKNATVSIQQNLFSGFQTVNGSKEAKEQVKAGQGSLLNTEQQILLATVTSYMDVKRDIAVLALTENNVQVLRRQLQASKDRFEVGEITRTDVAQSKARLARSISERTKAEASLAVSRSSFRRVVGFAPGTLKDAKMSPNLPGTEDEALAIATRDNPILMSARHIEKSSLYSVKREKGGLLPTVNLQASYGRAWDTNYNVGGRSTVKSVTAQLSIPIYQAGQQSSRIRQAQEINNQRRLEVIATSRQVEEAVRNAWEGYRETTARITSSEEQVEANKIALDGVKQEAYVGSRTILDVLNAEQEYLDAQVALVRSERDKLVSAYELLSSIGGMTAQKLGLQANYYDPDANADSVGTQIYGW